MRCQTPSQNTTFKMYFKNDRSAGNGAYIRKGPTSRAIVASMPTVSF
jgi:hypothetical protein